MILILVECREFYHRHIYGHSSFGIAIVVGDDMVRLAHDVVAGLLERLLEYEELSLV